ncbi:hypothetical protein E2C01_090113 [Portunus trituberculatus]|uniref:Uncharacterized protein n=2 Tax=Portunus trituberculatus TaxID=210409 RepID=A0A5B7JFC8_PORTR|nr:hypothetical protein [Portunus trituberculatus]
MGPRGMRQDEAGHSGKEVPTLVRLRGEGSAWDCVAAEPLRRRSSSATSDVGLLTPSGSRNKPPATWRFSVPLTPGRLPLSPKAGQDKAFDAGQDFRGKVSGHSLSRGARAGLLRRLALRIKEGCLK